MGGGRNSCLLVGMKCSSKQWLNLSLRILSCFKLPEGLCHDLNVMFQNFWWGHHDKAKKAHWIYWGKLCTSKDVEGLGFQDLRTFNLALLAKQGWHFLQNLEALISRMFKAKYFPNCDFLEARVGHRPSYAWRSIIAARPTLMLGLRWQIGDGRLARITEDPWLPLSSSFKSHSAQQCLDSNEKILILISKGSHSWNEDAIRGLFSTWEANIILSILLPPWPRPDQLLWNATKLGRFSVKSAYHL